MFLSFRFRCSPVSTGEHVFLSPVPCLVICPGAPVHAPGMGMLSTFLTHWHLSHPSLALGYPGLQERPVPASDFCTHRVGCWEGTGKTVLGLLWGNLASLIVPLWGEGSDLCVLMPDWETAKPTLFWLVRRCIWTAGNSEIKAQWPPSS